MRKSIQLVLTAALLFNLTACSGGKPAQNEGSVATSEVSAAGEAGRADAERSGLTDPTQADDSKENRDAQGGEVLMITSMAESAEQPDIAPSDAQAVKISLKDDALYLEQEVLGVQSGVGSDASGNRTPAFLIKVKPGKIGGYTQGEGDEARADSFQYTYINEEKAVGAILTLSNHFMKPEDFTKSTTSGEDVTTSDGTLLNIGSLNHTGRIDKAKIYDPDFGAISVNLSYDTEEGYCKTGEDVMNVIKPFLADFKSQFEIISEISNSAPTSRAYVELDTDYLSYNVNNTEKLDLDFNIFTSNRMHFSEKHINITFKHGANDINLTIKPSEDSLNETTEVAGSYVSNEELLEQYGKGLLVPLTVEGNNNYGFDRSNLLLLTGKAAIEADTFIDDEGSFTKEEIENRISFLFDKGALTLK